jgi:uncharacterized protein (DUF885 family)
MKSLKSFVSCAVLCASVVLAGSAGASDREFEELANSYVDSLMRMNPEWATQLGDHRFDGELTDMSAEAIEARTRANREMLERLAKIDPSSLDPENRVDYAILESNVERLIFQAEELREWEWNPIRYNPGGAIYALLSREFAPMEARLESVRKRLEKIPGALEVAKANLKNPPKVHTETAISQNQGTIALIEDDLDNYIDEAPSMRAALEPAREAAVDALKAYGEWLQNDLLPRSTGDFRLGDPLWRKKLRYSLDSDLSKEQILERANEELVATQNRMYNTALPLFRKYFPAVTDEEALSDVKHVIGAVLDRLAEDRPTNDDVVDRAREALSDVTAFTRHKDLVTLPDEPVRLIVMPEFQRGVAVAYCDAPGPLDKTLATFFAISPTPKGWSEERVESFFKEYNDYMLYDLTIHEAVPGHYLQLAHANQFTAPTMIRAIFSSGPFVEGWAVYSEKFMAEAGFGGAEVRMEQLKMRLRVIINAIVDQKIHTEGMTKEQAMALMMNEGFQEEGEAAGKWRRSCLTSTQLSTYFVGSAEVEDIRLAYEKRHPGVALGEIHDKMLSFGSPPPKYVRELMGL